MLPEYGLCIGGRCSESGLSVAIKGDSEWYDAEPFSEEGDDRSDVMSGAAGRWVGECADVSAGGESGVGSSGWEWRGMPECATSTVEKTAGEGYAISSAGGVVGGESGTGGILGIGRTTEYLERFLAPPVSSPKARAKAERDAEPELLREPGDKWIR